MSGEIIMTDEDGIKYKAEWKNLDDGYQDSENGGNKEELN